MSTIARSIGMLLGLAAMLAACGDGANDVGPAEPVGTPSSPRTIDIAMADIAFEPAALTVQSGETVRFVFANEGAVPHEAVFGGEDVQAEHAAEMQAAGGSEEDMDMGDMDMGATDDDHAADGGQGSEPGATTDGADAEDERHDDEVGPLSLEPGGTGEVVVTFDAGGSTIIGCHVPGHWEAGMRLDVTVESA